MMHIKQWVFVPFVFMLVGCVSMTQVPVSIPDQPGDKWYSHYEQDHTLVGRIWSPKQKQFVTRDEVMKSLLMAQYVLLGEQHDNIDHHQIQAWLVDQLVQSGGRTTVAFEMLDVDQSHQIDAFLKSPNATPAGFGSAVGWKEAGGYSWLMYQPIVDAAMSGQAPILAASFPRSTIFNIVRNGYDVLNDDELEALRLQYPFDTDFLEAMADTIRVGHLDQLPEDLVIKMARMQTAKDANMARILIKGATEPDLGRSILIAGGGHVRTDIGVPVHLKRMAGENVNMRAVAFVEVNSEEDEPEMYGVPLTGSEWLPFDYVWFTPRVVPMRDEEKEAEKIRKSIKRHSTK